MNLLIAAHDTGAANALSPVITELRGRSGMTVTVVAGGPAERVFGRMGIQFQPVVWPSEPTADSDRHLRDLLRETAPKGILLGTGWGDTLDKAILRLATERCIPSCSFVDTWIYFKERFWDSKNRSLRLPTRLAVVDEEALQQARIVGISPDTVVVTGQPYLEALAQQMQRPDLLQQAQRLRQIWLGDLGSERRLILFASEAYADFWGPGSPYYRGYTEEDALEGLVEAVEVCERATGLSLSIVVKLHPCQSGAPARLGAGAIRRGVRVIAEEPIWPCLLAADTVVGMTSMALIEASIAGKPVVSFQPGWQGPHPFTGTPFTLIPTVLSHDALAQWLKSAVSAGAVAQPAVLADRLRSLIHGLAAARIADLLLELCRSSEPAGSSAR